MLASVPVSLRPATSSGAKMPFFFPAFSTDLQTGRRAERPAVRWRLIETPLWKMLLAFWKPWKLVNARGCLRTSINQPRRETALPGKRLSMMQCEVVGQFRDETSWWRWGPLWKLPRSADRFSYTSIRPRQLSLLLFRETGEHQNSVFARRSGTKGHFANRPSREHPWSRKASPSWLPISNGCLPTLAARTVCVRVDTWTNDSRGWRAGPSHG
ncbi:hypothetical protein VTI74DRAFT_415 [Chaetomium olivicolor]